SHGSPQTSLLKQRQPFICMTCHQTSRTNHDAMVSGGLQLPGNGGGGTYNMLLARGCSNCHSKVHGSNAPSGGMLTH
ncbi:MAG: cytochrome C, partial [Magnetospirillum sp.]|nr:cytochrome C [Magnetospirillum sp.]